MNNMQHMKENSDQIATYVRSLGLKVFPGIPVIGDESKGIVVWDPRNEDWKSFIEIAREEGAKTVIILGKLEKEEKYSPTLAWIKDGIIYWFGKDIDSYLSTGVSDDVNEEGEGSVGPHIPMGSYASMPRKSLKEIKKKSEEEIVQEILQFATKEFKDTKISTQEIIRLYWQRNGLLYDFVDDPEVNIKIRKVDAVAQQKLEDNKAAAILGKSDEELAEQLSKFLKDQAGDGLQSFRATDIFWESFGIQRYSSDAKVRLKMEKANSLVQQEQLKKEKESLGKLTDECLSWAKENGLRKLTKSNVDYFLSEKEVQLSKQSRDALYTQANFKLSKLK